jgi:hypothetical protein
LEPSPDLCFDLVGLATVKERFPCCSSHGWYCIAVETDGRHKVTAMG